MTKQVSLVGKACIAVFLGTIDFNICRKSWVEANKDVESKE